MGAKMDFGSLVIPRLSLISGRGCPIVFGPIRLCNLARATFIGASALNSGPNRKPHGYSPLMVSGVQDESSRKHQMFGPYSSI